MNNFATLEKIIFKKIERAYVAWMEGDDATTKASLYQAASLSQKYNIYTIDDEVQSLWGDFLYGFGDFANK